MNEKASKYAWFHYPFKLGFAKASYRTKGGFLKRRTILAALLVGIALIGIGLTTGPVMSAEDIDPDADRILRSMSDYLSGLSAFSATVDIDNEIIDLSGQKLQLSATSSLIVERPGKFFERRQDRLVDRDLIFDGKVLTLYSKRINAYYQIETPGETIDDAIQAMHVKLGLDVPGADLFSADPYFILSDGVVSGHYLGTAIVGGIKCHYLAFRKDEVDLQLWVQTGDTPLPMKYIITTKWMTGAPQYSLRFRDWNTKPEIEAALFEFTIPEGAWKLQTLHINEFGELVLKAKEDQ